MSELGVGEGEEISEKKGVGPSEATIYLERDLGRGPISGKDCLKSFHVKIGPTPKRRKASSAFLFEAMHDNKKGETKKGQVEGRENLKKKGG